MAGIGRGEESVEWDDKRPSSSEGHPVRYGMQLFYVPWIKLIIVDLGFYQCIQSHFASFLTSTMSDDRTQNEL
jgi:hypothetical protein